MAKKKKRGATPQATPPANESAEERAARRTQQKEEWARQKAAGDRAANRSYGPILAAGGVIVALAVIIPVAFLLFGGGGGDDAWPTPSAVADPRLGAQVPQQTFAMSADDDGQNINPRFEPSTFTVKAGQVFEIDVTNNGTVHHNVTIDGGDGDYGTADDWSSVPVSFDAGETAIVRARFNKAGVYQFECNLHAGIQVGTITVVEASSGSSTPVATPTTTPSRAPSAAP
jgi:plastocyanin